MFTKSVMKSCLLGLALALGLVTGQAAANTEVEDRIGQRLMEAIPKLKIEAVQMSEAQGLYEVHTTTGDVIYTTEDGQYLLTGDLLKVTSDGIANITEQARTSARKEALDAFGEEGVISYPAKGEQKAEVAVFTDIDCPYCRKFHDDVPRLNELGITVNYYGFPRSGPGTASFRKYESVWCADDQREAMDAAKQGRQVESSSCENPVREQFQLGNRIGVTGTPAIVLEDGNMVRGYVPAERLAEGLGLL